MRKAEPPPLSNRDTLSDSLRLTIAEGLDHLDAHLAAARAGDDEAIHQARVALRRLRSALRLFGRHLDPVARDGFNDALRTLGRALGGARDWDVFVLETIPAVHREAPDAGGALAAMIGPAGQARREAHLALQAALDDPRNAAVLQDLRDWARLAVAFATPEAAGRRIGREAEAMLDRLARRVRRRGRHLSRLDDEGRHELRKALKALRYGIEMLQALHGERGMHRYRRRLAALQEDLGRLNDAIAAADLAGRLEAGAGREAVAGWSAGRRQAALEELPAAWRRFRAMRPFW